MAEEKYEPNHPDPQHKNASIQPDKETTKTTDPQEHMEGPISSLMQGAEKLFSSDADPDKNDSNVK